MSRRTSVALLSATCRFPDANSTNELWDNVVEGRRSFRAIPRERIDICRYAADIVGEAESITRIRAALLTNWTVDRGRFRIPQATFAATDLTHWLALELAAEAIESIGGLGRLDRTRTAVIVANTLTGEFSRAALLRLRLPFLDDILSRAADGEQLPPDASSRIRSSFAARLREHFPEPNEDSLAGGLANTIAGRIANHFDLRGGAYSIDGACASSLLALFDAANLLTAGHVDAVVVAAVDLSLDPFELVGFSRNGALAADTMRVFDARSCGFWPGEGGACVLLMRESDAVRRGLPVLARIRGWGISSDGAGGLTRPSREGQLMAYRRAYEMAEVNPADLAFVEAHGTGTAVGDPIEVRALAELRKDANSPLAIGSIKANIGHTKAAAGLAGLLKAVEALRHGILPPHVSCETPHPIFAEVDHRVLPILAGEPVDDRTHALAGVSSFGFGGINAHIVIEGAQRTARPVARPRPSVPQDAELFLFSGETVDDVTRSITALERRAPTLSIAELTDAAAYAASTQKYGTLRVAVVAGDGDELTERLARAKAALLTDETVCSPESGVVIGRAVRSPRIGFLFPGQGAPCRPDGGLWLRRFPDVAGLIANLPSGFADSPVATEIAQPAIVSASLAALQVLEDLGISATAAVGHSLGELAALVWAGAWDSETALEFAGQRGALMANFGAPGGRMLRMALSPGQAEKVARDFGAVVACRNGRSETVLAGSADAVAKTAAYCAERGIETTALAVSLAFHSQDMAPAVPALSKALKATHFARIARTVVSTVTGAALAADTDLRCLLLDQLTSPVLFDRAAAVVAAQSDFLVEVGPGQSLTRLMRQDDRPVMTIDAFADSLRPLLSTLGALFVAGVNVRTTALFDRPVRRFNPDTVPSFIASPCRGRTPDKPIESATIVPAIMEQAIVDGSIQASNPLAVVRAAIAQETELANDRIGPDDRFLDALHLNSLSVARIVTAAAKALKVRLPSAPTEFANATPQLLADALQELVEFGQGPAPDDQRIGGVRPWVRTYGMNWQVASEPRAQSASIRWLMMTSDQDSAALRARRDNENGLLIAISGAFGMADAERLILLVATATRAGISHLAICHHGSPVAAFGRSVAQEGHFQSVRVIDCPAERRSDPRHLAALSTEVLGYYEIRLAQSGAIEEPVFQPKLASSDPRAALTGSDVVVVVGGGKGIAAECALHVAQSGAATILVGRSTADDPEVTATLARAQRNGFLCRYVQADALDRLSLSIALQPALDEFGQATALIYAPAVNEPKRITELDRDAIRRTLAPKIAGLEITLSVLGPTLRRLVTFSSIIGRIGLEGESHYALANAMQTAATEAWVGGGPGRTCLAIEWTVWGGTGMGERLGTIERLSGKGVDAISVDDALSAFDRFMTQGATGTVAVTSRFGPPPDLSLGKPDLPMLRFIGEPKVHFPGVELVIETTLLRGTDGYIDDHVINGHAVLPAVIGLEAMAQVACVLRPFTSTIAIRDVILGRAISIPAAAATRIRIAAICSENGNTEVTLSTEDDEFTVPCMRAVFTATDRSDAAVPADLPETGYEFAAAPLYGPLFFGGGLFRRLQRVEMATSRQVAARLGPANQAGWFGPYEPDTFILWDPGLTDAALHALQVAVPHRQVLPIGAELIEIDPAAGPPARVRAVERSAFAGTYVFDLLLMNDDGRVAQRWTGVTFRAVDRTDIRTALAAAPQLAVPYLERMAREALGDDSIRLALLHDPHGTRASRRAAALAMLELTDQIERRVDGRPICVNASDSVSIAHQSDITLAVVATAPIACDIETCRPSIGTDAGAIHRHLAFEVCRKLGRLPAARPASSFATGRTEAIGDVELVLIDLPIPCGNHVVAFGRVKSTSRKQTALSVEEVVS
jgi:enediyne polyketide synthase